jgi:hypothetical protein
MSKNVLISGSFDIISLTDIHLIREAKKLTLKGGNVFVLLFADYTNFILFRSFPTQATMLRKNNLEYFVNPDNIEIINTSDYKGLLDKFLPSFQDVVYVHYNTDKEFIGRDIFKKYSIPIKFIKKPKI